MSQVPVKETKEGIRPGANNWTARGAVSPLGGASAGNSSNQSAKVEQSQQQAGGRASKSPYVG